MKSNGSNSYEPVRWYEKKRVGSAYSKKFEVKVGVFKDLCCRHYCLK